MPLLLLVAIFIAVPIAELYLILQVGDAIGAVWTILLLAADSLLGTMLLRSQGRAVWRRFSEAVNAGRVPHKEIQAGVAIVFGGAFLITPGFLTDIVGIALLLPPTRAVILKLVMARIAKRARVAARGPGGPGFDVEGTATEQTVDRGRLSP